MHATGLAAWLPLVAGVRVRVDPALAGAGMEAVASDDTPATGEALLAMRSDERWVRIAALDAWNRWLQAPLDQALIDAERAVARADIVEDLRGGPLRTALLGETVELARHAGFGLVSAFQRLPRPAPGPIDDGVRWLIEGYRRLATAVAEPDDMVSVVRAGQHLLASRHPRAATPAVPPVPGPPRYRRTAGAWTSAIDPRQVPARVLALADDPTRGEVVARLGRVNGIPVLDVRVAAYGEVTEDAAVDDVHERLIARFVDRITADIRAETLLTAEVRADAAGKRHVFRTRLPLDDAEPVDPARLRVDVVDAEIEVPPARTDGDLIGIRTAMISLRDARAEAAAAGLDEPTGDRDPDRPMVAELVLAQEVSRSPGS